MLIIISIDSVDKNCYDANYATNTMIEENCKIIWSIYEYYVVDFNNIENLCVVWKLRIFKLKMT